MSLVSEMLSCTLGVLDPDKATASNVKAAGGLADSWRKRLRAWLWAEAPAWEHGEEFAPWSDDTLPGWGYCWERLSAEPEWEEIGDHLAKYAPEVAAETVEDIKLCRSYLYERFPTIVIEEVGYNIPIPPAEDEAADWRALCSVLDSGDRFITEIEMGTVEPGQVEAFKACKPELFGLLHKTLQAMITEARSARKSIPWERQDVIRRLAMLPEEQQPAKEDVPAEEIAAAKGGEPVVSSELAPSERPDFRGQL